MENLNFVNDTREALVKTEANYLLVTNLRDLRRCALSFSELNDLFAFYDTTISGLLKLSHECLILVDSQKMNCEILQHEVNVEKLLKEL